jgi:hypothetical protein
MFSLVNYGSSTPIKTIEPTYRPQFPPSIIYTTDRIIEEPETINTGLNYNFELGKHQEFVLIISTMSDIIFNGSDYIPNLQQKVHKFIKKNKSGKYLQNLRFIPLKRKNKCIVTKLDGDVIFQPCGDICLKQSIFEQLLKESTYFPDCPVCKQTIIMAKKKVD